MGLIEHVFIVMLFNATLIDTVIVIVEDYVTYCNDNRYL